MSDIERKERYREIGRAIGAQAVALLDLQSELDEAAAEIERLRAENERLRAGLWKTTALIAHGMKMSERYIIDGEAVAVQEIWQIGKDTLQETDSGT